MTTAALIVAAGRGTRAAAEGAPAKQYADLAGRPVLWHAVAPFARHAAIAHVLVVIHPDDATLYDAAVAGMPKLAAPAPGGATRQASVLAGLEALAPLVPSRVLIHDAARPFADAAIISRVLSALDTCAGALPGLAVVDTLKRADAEGRVAGTVDRSGLYRAQTPQGFDFRAILAAHRNAAAAGRTDFTDDVAVAEWAGLPVALDAGSAANIKLTTPDDLAMAARALTSAHETRVGQGFDVHRFTAGDRVWLCGVRVPHSHGVEAHSDGDVALHALTDAILGALGDGDIGQHFPPSDPRWRGAPSSQFLADAARRVTERGGRIVHVDITILAEAPRIGPHRDAMRAAIAATLAIGISRVGVKATTTERLGFTGRREGLAALATATVALPQG